MSTRAKQARVAELPKPKPPKGAEIIRVTDHEEAASIFLAGLVAQGRVAPRAIVRIYIDNLTAFAFDTQPPAVVVELLGPGGVAEGKPT